MPHHPGIMWGLPLLCPYMLAATAIDWLTSPAVHSAGLVMWDIVFFYPLPRPLS